MIDAGEVIGYAETDLGLLHKPRYVPQHTYQRLGDCVLQLQDRQHAARESKTITTVASTGTYSLGDQKYDKIMSIVWPTDWIETSALATSHTMGSDITSDVIWSSDGLTWVPKNTLLSWQRYVDAVGSGVNDSPIMWSHWKDADQILNIGLADSSAIDAGLEITVWLDTMVKKMYLPTDTINLEPYYETLLKYMLCFEMAKIYDKQSIPIYRDLVRVERHDLEREHAMTAHTQVKHFDTNYFPAE